MTDRTLHRTDAARGFCPSDINQRASRHRRGGRSGFTLIELLVVITIILIVSAVALPTVLPALSHRQVSEGARILQAALAGARDSAIKNNRPSGIRLLPDPAFPFEYVTKNSVPQIDPSVPLAYNRVVPIASAPDYTEGLATQWPAGTTLPAGIYAPSPLCLMVYEGIVSPTTGLPNSPTSWFWNVRVGDKIQINNAGAWYTVVGPMAVTAAGGNTELFVNGGPPGTQSPLNYPQGSAFYPEYLFLVNGQDDNGNGWIDEGWDGVDNDGDGLFDEAACTLFPQTGEWESEVWAGSLFNATPNLQYAYTIRRRPAPTGNAREVLLPTNVVVDMTTWNTTFERSQLGVNLNHLTGYADILVNPNGTVIPTTIYSVPSVVGMGGTFIQLWLAERSDVYAPSGTVAPAVPVGIIQPQLLVNNPYSGTRLQGEYRLITIFTRTGQITSSDNVLFDNPVNPASGTYNPNYPFIAAQQGVRGGQ